MYSPIARISNALARYRAEPGDDQYRIENARQNAVMDEAVAVNRLR